MAIVRQRGRGDSVPGSVKPNFKRALSERSGPNLPVPLSRMIDRERDLARGTALLRDRAVRLLTLTGPPGVGKSRLAVALALG
jgi:hypothetical protein